MTEAPVSLVERLRACGPGYQRHMDLLTEAASRIEALERERGEARTIVRDIHWMAVRYADGRMSYAPGMVNDALKYAYDGGWLQYQNDGATPQFARDGNEPEWKDIADGLAAAESQIAALKDGLRQAEGALKLTECLRPGKGEPDDLMAEACFKKGVCGCCYGTAFAAIARALVEE